MKNWRTLLLGVTLCASTAFAAPQEVDKVAAVVNNGVVLQSDVDGLMQSVKQQAGQAKQQLPDDATLRHQILDRLIMDQIQLQMASKMGITNCGVKAQVPVPESNRPESWLLAVPIEVVSVIRGNSAARAAPIDA